MCGKRRYPSCVLVMADPSGSWTEIAVAVGRTLETGMLLFINKQSDWVADCKVP